MEPVTELEIRKVIFGIPNDKAPGPDGLSSAIFKHSWGMVGKKISEAVIDFMNTRKLLKEINCTNLVLIPKCDHPSSVTEFRLIACCNLIYKVIL